MFPFIKAVLCALFLKPKPPEPLPPCRTGRVLQMWITQRREGDHTFLTIYRLIGADDNRFYELRMIKIEDRYWNIRCRRLGQRQHRVRCPQTKNPLTPKQALNTIPCLRCADKKPAKTP